MPLLCCKKLALVILSLSYTTATVNFSTYFANWALYHLPPYGYEMNDLSPLVSSLSEVNYAFMYFCPPPGTDPLPYWAKAPYGSCSDATAFQLMSVEPKDDGFLQTLVTFRTQNPGLRLMLSVGGWNFPSAYFSDMAASAATRQTFINSVIQWLTKYNLDGVDIDCS